VSRDFGKQLQAHGSDPLLWREQAIEMKIAADALVPHYYLAIKERKPQRESQQRMFGFFHGYVILIGLAIENALKGLRISEDPSLVTPEKVGKGILGRGGHGIREGLRRYVSLDAEEIDAVTRLEEFLVWAAKYPVPITVGTLENAETKVLRSHISTDPETLNRVLARLLDCYPSSASPYTGDLD